ncbi:MAG: hypothetical protein U0Z26_07490 [Anaerolineales bacterium]
MILTLVSDKLYQMPADILVVTSNEKTGEAIRQTMEETGLYRIHVVTNSISHRQG